jgi:predicted porin
MKGLGTAAASAAVIVLSGGGAYAADLNTMPVKAVPIAGPAVCTSILDFFTTACQVSAYGVRFYGTVDLSGQYETNGAAPNPQIGVNSFLGKSSFGPRFVLAPNQLSASNVGFQIKEPLAPGWSFVGQVEAGFDPASMQLLSGVHSVATQVGVPLAQQNAAGDSNSQGQFYNDLGFFGFSNDTYGTLTFFRQNSLMQDAVLSYDPMGVAAGFSPLGFFGSYAGGGDTENRRDTTAIKYRVNLANWHFGAYGQVGGYEDGNASRGAVQGDVGADYRVGPGTFSADVIGGYRKDAVSLGVGETAGANTVNAFGQPINTNLGGLANQFEQATISNNTNVMAVAKYTVDRLRLYAGYELIQFQNPSDPFSGKGNGFNDIAGDFLCVSCQSINGTNINSTAYNTTRITQIAWFGAKYSLTDSLDVTGAYYHEQQNNYSGGAANAAGGTCALASTALASCAGTRDSASALLDWKFAPKWDTYLGVLYSRNTGGIDNGFLADNVVSTTAGLRFRW